MLKSTSGKLSAAGGVITLSVIGANFSLTAEQMRQWLAIIVEFAPIFISLVALYILYEVHMQHRKCQESLNLLHKQTLVAYRTVHKVADDELTKRLPTPGDFAKGRGKNFEKILNDFQES